VEKPDEGAFGELRAARNTIEENSLQTMKIACIDLFSLWREQITLPE
jgi:hypothetical protein